MGGLNFGELAERYGRLDPDAALASFGHAVLVERKRAAVTAKPPPGAEGVPPPAPRLFSTRRLDERHIARSLIGMLSLVPDARVVPLRKGTTTGFAQMVTVGRAPNMDVVLEDDSVSKFHAFFTQDADGWLLEDAGSTNGTLVNDHRLAPHGGGTRLRVGARIVFGSAPAYSFFPPRGFHALLREAAAVDPADDLTEPADPAEQA